LAPITDASALEFAGFWRRLAAFIIDLATGTIISMIFYPLLHFIRQADYGVALISTSFYSNTIIGLIIMAYFAGFWARRGQTPGKMLMNIKVIRTSGNNLSLGYALLRCLGYVISISALGFGFLWIAYDGRKQGWHDKIADTYVIKLPPPTPREVFPAAKPSAG